MHILKQNVYLVNITLIYCKQIKKTESYKSRKATFKVLKLILINESFIICENEVQTAHFIFA